MSAPNPMVTLFKTLDVTPLVRFGRKRGLKFNMLLCRCIGKAAGGIKEFYTLPVGRELLQYDSIAVNTIVKNKNGELSSCDVPFSDSLAQFNADYLRLTHAAAESCENHDLTDSMVIGTSAIVDTEIDGAVGMNSGIFCLVGALATFCIAYLLTALAKKIGTAQSKLLRTVLYYITIELLLIDPLYLSLLCGLFGGGDMNGIQKADKFTVDVPITCKRGLPHHTWRGASQTAAHLGARRVQACSLP